MRSTGFGKKCAILLCFFGLSTMVACGGTDTPDDTLDNNDILAGDNGGDVAQVGPLVANPDPIDFGNVQAGQSREMDVTVTNVGEKPIEVTDAYLDFEGSPDFTFVSGTLSGDATAGNVIQKGESLVVRVRYQPTDRGPDESRLIVGGLIDGQDSSWSFAITGVEVGPQINVIPAQVNFCIDTIGQTASSSLTITNLGTASLNVSAITLADGSNADLEIENPPESGSPIVIGIEEFFVLKVKMTLSALPDDPSEPIGTIVIASDDVVTGLVNIPVYISCAGPSVEVIPTSVDFGFGAQNTPKYATLTIKNNGTSDLTIQGLEITDESRTEYGQEFKIVADPEVSVTSLTSPTPTVVPAGGFIPVEMTFTNQGAGDGEVSATLVITSNDPATPTLDVPLIAKTTEIGFCRAQLVPSTINFGTVAVGSSDTKEARLVNTGSGACTITGGHIADCWIDGDSGTAVCPDALAGDDSALFEIVSTLPTGVGALGPGQSKSVQIRYTAKTIDDPQNTTGVVSALLSLRIKDVASDTEYVIPECSGGCTPNVLAGGGSAHGVVLPPSLDFGNVATGCSSKTRTICVYNTGTSPLEISAIETTGCGTDFVFSGVPEMPASMAPGANSCFQAVYVPAAVGEDSCSVSISSNDPDNPVLTVPLAAEGVELSQQVDEFVTAGRDPVDILFVIDDSGSMCDDQARLLTALNGFTAGLSTLSDGDYHVGVISIDADTAEVAGRLNRGDDTVVPRFVTPSVDAQTQLETLVDIGCDGASTREAGLEAAMLAVTPPLAAEGGFNAGFLRQDAILEIIMMSDEQDQSTGTVQAYVSMFQSLKGADGANRVHVNALAGIPGVPQAGDENSVCSSTDGSTAEDGSRYIEAADLTGGESASICEPSYSDFLDAIAARYFGPTLDFVLTRPADEATVGVAVDDNGDGNFVACLTGWTFDSAANSIVFDPEGACVPGAGDHIRISYDALCLTD